MSRYYKSIFGWRILMADCMAPKEAKAWRLMWCLVDLVLIFLFALLLLAMLVGCAIQPAGVAVPVVIAKPVEVKIAVRVPCIERKDVPVRPVMPKREVLSAMPDYELLLTIEQLRRELDTYAMLADAALAGCVK